VVPATLVPLVVGRKGEGKKKREKKSLRGSRRNTPASLKKGEGKRGKGKGKKTAHFMKTHGTAS